MRGVAAWPQIVAILVVAVVGIALSLSYANRGPDHVGPIRSVPTRAVAVVPTPAGPSPIYRVYVVGSEAAAVSVRARLAAQPEPGVANGVTVVRTPDELERLLEILGAGDPFRAAAWASPVEVVVALDGVQ